MFTGIIRQIGLVEAVKGRALKVRARLPRAKAGDSVAVNGACLTVTKLGAGSLSFDVSEETRRLTNLSLLRPGMRVNLEPALRLGDVLDGHMVSGHVDARAAILLREELPGGFTRVRVALPPALRGLAALKGSIAVDGVSLTLTACGRDYFETVLVPHTLQNTTLGGKKKGDAVNLEADLIARYVSAALKK